MDDYLRGMEGFEGLGEQESLGGREQEKKQPQLTERQTKALLSELSPKLKEELCRVLQAQSKGTPDGERPEMSRELARILTRFQRRAGLGPGGSGRGFDEGTEETWPMYLGIFLFIAIAIMFVFLYIQEQRAAAEEEREEEQDAYWILREF
uniref:Uncharacterized protein n=1 Tax=Alexandrium monilatum TaxID=311494 RepID=A0A7S4VMU1_9DINO|mmetsp:Transcript_633/g.2221  ORF Transcript_633/g.2221 Transcript_633/m.2221 type:complete len:151 (+) Transcript_633:137-589(+)